VRKGKEGGIGLADKHTRRRFPQEEGSGSVIYVKGQEHDYTQGNLRGKIGKTSLTGRGNRLS